MKDGAEEACAADDAELDVVICTYNNSALLDRVLGALARQRPAVGGWSVLVVDNNSDDGTADVIERYRIGGEVPGLRRVHEPVQGLTPARIRGALSTGAPWLAFVDDDCVVDPGWVDHIVRFARAHPDCAGIGGRVTPEYVCAKPRASGIGWVFAEQDHGDAAREVRSLVGAGMVINRSVLERTGWTERAYLADRVGLRLVSGGDVELALRLRATGRPLWYTPGCEISHIIPAGRTTPRYLVRIVRGLGISSGLAEALAWDGPPRSWFRARLSAGRSTAVAVVRAVHAASRRQVSVLDLVLTTSFEVGRWIGTAKVALLLFRGLCDFFGVARPQPGAGELRSMPDR